MTLALNAINAVATRARHCSECGRPLVQTYFSPTLALECNDFCTLPRAIGHSTDDYRVGYRDRFTDGVGRWYGIVEDPEWS